MGEKKPEKSVWENMWEGAKDAFAEQPAPRQLSEAEKAENARRLAPKTGNIKKYGIDKAFGSGE